MILTVVSNPSEPHIFSKRSFSRVQIYNLLSLKVYKTIRTKLRQISITSTCRPIIFKLHIITSNLQPEPLYIFEPCFFGYFIHYFIIIIRYFILIRPNTRKKMDGTRKYKLRTNTQFLCTFWFYHKFLIINMSYYDILFRSLNEISTLCRSTRSENPTNGVRNSDDAVRNHEIHYNVQVVRTEQSYFNNYPIEFMLFNYSVRDILLHTPWRIAETRVLFDRGRT